MDAIEAVFKCGFTMVRVRVMVGFRCNPRRLE